MMSNARVEHMNRDKDLGTPGPSSMLAMVAPLKPILDRPFKCTVCPESFIHSSDLDIHMKTHYVGEPQHNFATFKGYIPNGSPPMTVPVPGPLPVIKPKEDAPVKTESEPAADRPHKCSVCPKSFKQSYGLQRHLKTHTGEKPHTCVVCSKSFGLAYHLKAHLRIHTGDKPFKCPACAKCFRQSYSLQRHKKTHIDKKGHTCTICLKGFDRSYSLQRHMRTHTGVKPYSCNMCPKSFTMSHHLSAHIRTHTRDKPYACSICAKAFSQSYSLKRHMKCHNATPPKFPQAPPQSATPAPAPVPVPAPTSTPQHIILQDVHPSQTQQ